MISGKANSDRAEARTGFRGRVGQGHIQIGEGIVKPSIKKGWETELNNLNFEGKMKKLARPEGLEPPTLGSEDRCSIH